MVVAGRVGPAEDRVIATREVAAAGHEARSTSHGTSTEVCDAWFASRRLVSTHKLRCGSHGVRRCFSRPDTIAWERVRDVHRLGGGSTTAVRVGSDDEQADGNKNELNTSSWSREMVNDR